MPYDPYASKHVLFKAYDIRGQRDLFTTEFMHLLSKAFVTQFIDDLLSITDGISDNSSDRISKTTVVIGHDVRHGSRSIAQMLAAAFNTHGFKVIWLGLVTTPIMVFWANQYDGHGIIATASHSEKHINGIKWVFNGESPSGKDIQSLYHRVNQLAKMDNIQNLNNIQHTTLDSKRGKSQLNASATTAVSHAYFTAVAKALHTIQKTNIVTPIRPLKIVIDCLNGATAPFAYDFFKQHSNLCGEVIVINDTPNGDFPKGNPDPTEAGRLAELQRKVLSVNADIGLGFDGDGDRLTVVDNLGQVVAADHLLYLLANIAINEHPTAISSAYMNTPASPHVCPTIIFDVKCSHHLPTLIQQIGGNPQMFKTGSSLMRKALQAGNSNAIFAGELSGHFLFNDGYFLLHDDAMYAALRLINWLSIQPKTLANIIDDLPHMVNTPDVYLSLDAYCAKSTKVNKPQQPSHERPILNRFTSLCQQLQAYYSNSPIISYHLISKDKDKTILPAPLSTWLNRARLTCIDGIRLDFANGFGVIRASNTSNSLTVRLAGDTLADLEVIKQYFVMLCELIDDKIAEQIAKIEPNH